MNVLSGTPPYKSWLGQVHCRTVSKDLRQEFPGEEGYSARNLWDMRRLYETYKDFPNLRQLVAEIPWGQNLVILNKAESHEERVYYLNATAEMAWSRDVLLNQVKAQAYQRHVEQPKQTNFKQVLPEHFAEQANEVIKSTLALSSSASVNPCSNWNWKGN